MTKIKNVEKSIWDVEGFDVRFKTESDSANIPGDSECDIHYPYTRAAKEDMTVNEWKIKRFKNTFANYEVDVLKSNNEPAPGQTKLETVRDTYA